MSRRDRRGRGLRAVILVALLGTSPALAQPRVLPLDEVLARAEQQAPAVLRARAAGTRAAGAIALRRRALLPLVLADAGASLREGRAQLFNGVAFGAPSSTLGSSASIELRSEVSATALSALRGTGALWTAARADARAVRTEARVVAGNAWVDAGLAYSQLVLAESLAVVARTSADELAARGAADIVNPVDVARAAVAASVAVAAERRAAGAYAAAVARLGVTIGESLDPATVRIDLPARVDASDPSAPDDRTPAARAAAARARVAAGEQRDARLAGWPTLRLFASVGGFTNRFTDPRYVRQLAVDRAQFPCFEEARVREIVGVAADPAACAGIVPPPGELAAAFRANDAFPWRMSRNPVLAGFSITLPLFDATVRRRQAESQAAEAEARAEAARIAVEEKARVAAAVQLLAAARDAFAELDSAAGTARRGLAAAAARQRAGILPLAELLAFRGEYARVESDRRTALADVVRGRLLLTELVRRPATERDDAP